MLLFVCDGCGCVDAIELAFPDTDVPPTIFACTRCQTGVWHDRFPLQPYDPERDNVVNQPTGIGLG